MHAVDTKYPSGGSWTSSQAKLLAEFGERTGVTTTSSSASFNGLRASLPPSEHIPMTSYSSIPTLVDNDEEEADEDELADAADVRTPLKHLSYE